MTNEKYKEICDYLKRVIECSPWEGNVFTVGGCCRDALMGREIHDVDLAVTVPDGGVKFAEWLYEKGLTYGEPTYFRRFSTSRLTLREFPDYEIEVVQTRREQYTNSNSRNPEVAFGTLKEDCFRRDLTINSLYQDIGTGEVLDLTGRGVDDIKNKRIRTPLSPTETFQDDPLRILRTVRFAIRFGWKIPDEIMKAMAENALRLKIIRKERLAAEFEKLLVGPHPEKAFEILKKIGALPKLIPELCNTFRKRIPTEKPNERYTVWDATMDALKVSPPETIKRYAAIFSQMHRISIPYIEKKEKSKGGKSKSRPQRRGKGRSAIVTMALHRLHYDNDFIKRVKHQLPRVNTANVKSK